ncbi:MAG: response regulator [Acidobacteria bacterium]|jgi:CheY-like chemotaxis protein|nr:response regulator [Acidobacteriota bacterium]
MPPLTILYAEDNTVLMLNVTEMLEEEGWRVDACLDGTTALEKIESRRDYDLLLLDNNLPGVSGLELVYRARSLAHRQLTPIIVLSATEVGREARRVGASLFLKKTENIHEIVEHIVKLAGQQS